MANNVRHLVSTFFRKYKLAPKNITSEKLKSILESQGYDVVEFRSGYNTEDVAQLISLLGLEEYVQTNRGFTYADGSSRIVFVNGDLSDLETVYVLLHEEGHILCEHFGSGNIIGNDVVQEFEANEFLHYALMPPLTARLFIHRKIAVITAAALLIAAAAAFSASHFREEQKYTGDYYVTETGHKYHEEDCIYIKNKTGVRRMTKEEFESGDYTPCEVCLPP